MSRRYDNSDDHRFDPSRDRFDDDYFPNGNRRPNRDRYDEDGDDFESDFDDDQDESYRSQTARRNRRTDDLDDFSENEIDDCDENNRRVPPEDDYEDQDDYKDDDDYEDEDEFDEIEQDYLGQSSLLARPETEPSYYSNIEDDYYRNEEEPNRSPEPSDYSLRPNFIVQQRSEGRYCPGLYIFFLLLFLYSLQDMFANRVIEGGTENSRMGVYLTLFACILYTFGYFVYSRLSLKQIPTGLTCLGLILLWEILAYFFAYEDVASPSQRTVTIWFKLVVLAFSSLWIFLYNFFFYYNIKKKAAWNQTLVIIFAFFLFYMYYAFISIRISQNRTNQLTVITAAYVVLVFVPWMFLMSKWYRYFGFLVSLALTAFSAKRGAIMAYPLMLLSAYLVNVRIKRLSIKPIIAAVVVLILFAIGLVVVDRKYEGQLSNRFSKEALESGSNRIAMWTTLWENFTEDSATISQITGHGVAATIGVLKTRAHNDWLGFLWDYGYIGVSFMLSFYLLLLNRLRQLIRMKSPYAAPYASMITLMIMMSLYSIFYESHYAIFVFIFFGYIEARIYSDNRDSQIRLPVANFPVDDSRGDLQRRLSRSDDFDDDESKNGDGFKNGESKSGDDSKTNDENSDRKTFAS